MSIYKQQDLSRFPDCSALSVRGRCDRLTPSICQGQECTFKRSVEEDIDSLECSYQRLSSLDISTQMQIAKKYYDGLMLWSEVKTVKAFRAYRHFETLSSKASD